MSKRGLSSLGAGDGWTYESIDGRTNVSIDGHLEIHPCVLQDIGPLRLLPIKVVSRLTHYERPRSRPSRPV